MLRAS
jgi:actin-related protein 2